MPWIELHITTSAKHANELSDQLTSLGAKAVTFKDGGNQPIYEPSHSTPRVWEETIVTGLFAFEYPLSSVITHLENDQKEGLITHFQLKEMADEDWVRASLDSFKPMKFGKRLWICPSWQTPPDQQGINIILDPGLAFGTGTHPTTALCLEWLAENIHSEQWVIDYGCGSGILGIAALKLGAVEVAAVDHDPQALETAKENGIQNNLYPPNFTTFFPDELIKKQADLIIANILAKPLIELAETFAKLTKLNGKIILSGILKGHIEDVIDAYKPWYTMQQPVSKEEWVRLVGIRSNNN